MNKFLRNTFYLLTLILVGCGGDGDGDTPATSINQAVGKWRGPILQSSCIRCIDASICAGVGTIAGIEDVEVREIRGSLLIVQGDCTSFEISREGNQFLAQSSDPKCGGTTIFTLLSLNRAELTSTGGEPTEDFCVANTITDLNRQD
jgi:hypothetical protein